MESEKENVVVNDDNLDSYLEEKEYFKTRAEYEVNANIEKISLLSIISNVPSGKINSILKDYLSKEHLIDKASDEDFKKIIDTISKKNSLSNKTTASIIFSYKFEMLSRNEIEQDFIDGQLENTYNE